MRYCYETESEAKRANEMLEYELKRRDSALQQGVKTFASIGRCEPGGNKVVLVRNMNRYGDSEFIYETEPIDNVLAPLFDKWKPDIFIHLSEVSNTHER